MIHDPATMTTQADADAAFLSYLGQRLVGLRAAAERRPRDAELLRDRERQLEIMISEVAQGMHLPGATIPGVRARYGDDSRPGHEETE
jgi:hypothetical protein